MRGLFVVKKTILLIFYKNAHLSFFGKSAQKEYFTPDGVLIVHGTAFLPISNPYGIGRIEVITTLNGEIFVANCSGKFPDLRISVIPDTPKAHLRHSQK